MNVKNLWWIMLLRGIILVIFGIFAICWPAMTFLSLAFVFALYILLSGVLNIIHAITGLKTHRYWFLTLVLGVFEIGVGAYVVNNPLVNVAALILLIGFSFTLRGVFEIIASFDEVYTQTHRILLLVGGVLALLAGIITLRYPVVGSLAFTWVLGMYALITGSLVIALSFGTKEIFDTPQRGRRKRTR